MDILSPEKIKNDSNARAEESRTRVLDAAKEETRVMRKLNAAKDLFQKEMDRIDTEIAVKRKEYADIIAPLENEVVSLESRRKEAMRPIVDLREEAQNAINEAKRRLEAVIARETAVTTREDEVGQKMDALDEASDILGERKENMDRREEGLVHAEAVSKASTDDLNGRWVSYHKAVKIHNDSVEEKHLRIALREDACTKREADLGVFENQLHERERGINDKYHNLQIASAEFEKKQNESSN